MTFKPYSQNLLKFILSESQRFKGISGDHFGISALHQCMAKSMSWSADFALLDIIYYSVVFTTTTKNSFEGRRGM
jgi:hypothetical protein